MKVFTQSSFTGGLSQLSDITKLEPNSSYFVSNARLRSNRVEPILSPKDITGEFPAENVQALVGAGTVLVVINSGSAYFKDFSNPSATGFTRVGDFSMNPDAPEVWTALVPASTINKKRKYFGGVIEVGFLNFDAQEFVGGLSPSPACLVCQDGGLTRPRLIFSDGVGRLANGYEDWEEDNREYVPSGRQMYYDPLTAKLFVVSTNGRELYHSVTGRPVDFVIPVSDTGDKISSNEQEGGAPATAYQIDFNEITLLGGLNTAEGFFVGTQISGYLVSANFSGNLPWGEPTLSNTPLFDTGPVNQNCATLFGSDYGFIDEGGIRSFNATRQLQVESNNDTLSSRVHRLFRDDRMQNRPAAISQNDYSYFSINTRYGFGVLVYDSFLEQFVAFDQYEGIGEINRWAQIKVNGRRRLFFSTTDNRVYEALAEESTESPKIYFGDFTAGEPSTTLKPFKVSLTFTEAFTDGEVTVDFYVDGKLQNSQTKPVVKKASQTTEVEDVPFNDANDTDNQVIVFDVESSNEGGRLGCQVSWTADAKLTFFSLSYEPSSNLSSPISQQAEDFKNAKQDV